MIVTLTQLQNGKINIVTTGAPPKRRMYWSGEIRIVSDGQVVVQPVDSDGERLHPHEMSEWLQRTVAKELHAEFPNCSYIRFTIKTSNEPNRHD